MVRPDRSDLPGQDALRFDHVLVRDAAYNGLTKAARSRLHERFARWLDKHTEGQAYDDFIGSHLEAAYRNRADLGPVDDPTRLLGEEAAARLAGAGQLLLVTDDPAAIALLARALALHPAECPARWAIAFDKFEGLLRAGDLEDAIELVTHIRAAAEDADDLQWITRGRLAVAQVQQWTAPEAGTLLLRQEAERALQVLEVFGDEFGLGWAHLCLRQVADMRGQANASAREAQLAARYFDRAGRTRFAQTTASTAFSTMMAGDHPASLAIVEARQRTNTAEGRQLCMRAWVTVSFFAALLDLADEERQARQQVERLEAELRISWSTVLMHSDLGIAALVCGRATEAAALLALACERLEATVDVAVLSSFSAYYAHALLLAGERHTARQQVDRALAAGSSDDVQTNGLARSALAWLAALDGQDSAVVRGHMTDALAAIDHTDLILDRALVHAACAEAARLLGDETTARHHRQHAIDLYDVKENLVGAAVQRALL